MGGGWVIFIQNGHIYNMVINGVDNAFTDMILVAFDGKFDEKKMRYPRGFVDLIYFKLFNIGNGRTDINPKNGHKWGQLGYPMARIWHVA